MTTRQVELTDEQDKVLKKATKQHNKDNGLEGEAKLSEEQYLAVLLAIDLDHLDTNLPDKDADDVAKAFKTADDTKRGEIKAALVSLGVLEEEP